MSDIKKVMKGLECMANDDITCTSDCPYFTKHEYDCVGKMARDALELLREQPKQKFFVDSNGKITPLPIQKHGHWVFDPDGMDWNIPAWKCSECHCRNDNIPPNLERTNPLRWSGSKFCPNCGAKMDEKVVQDGS